MDKINQLIQEVGEAKAKTLLREYYSRPENIVDFSRLFPNHIYHSIPDFHREIYGELTQLHGYLGIVAPRGFSKSTITDLVFTLWAALHAKRNFIVIISDTYSQAVNMLYALKNELENNEALKWLYGDVKSDTWAENDIVVNVYDNEGNRQSVKIMAMGGGQKVRGLKFLNYRPDLIILDDIENDEAVASEERRKKLKRWLVMSVIPALAETGCIVAIGTVLHRDSLINNILNGKDEFSSWRKRKYTAILDDQSLWPERLTITELYQMRDDPTYYRYIGPLSFAQEMMAQPIADEDLIFKSEWIDNKTYKLTELVDHQSPETLTAWLTKHFNIIIGSVDPAISEKTTADYWAMSTIGVTTECPICPDGPAGHIVQLDINRVRESDPVKQVNLILDQYSVWKHDKIKIEVIAYQAGLYHLAKRLGGERAIYPPLRPYRPDRDKTRRAIIFSAIVAGGLLHLREDHPLYNIFREELLNFPQADHDDMLDSMMAAAEQVTMKVKKSRLYDAKPGGW